MDEILDPRTRTIDCSLRVQHHPAGYRIVWAGDGVVCMDSPDDVARCAQYVLALRENRIHKASVAILGGGLGVLTRLLGPAYTITVYEVEPALARFQPNYATFVPGRWQETITGAFDVIVLETGEPATESHREIMRNHLTPKGIILGDG